MEEFTSKSSDMKQSIKNVQNQNAIFVSKQIQQNNTLVAQSLSVL